MHYRAEWAKRKNAQGYNCSQSIALAYQDILPFDPKYLFQMTEGFGGGMGKMQETCGILTGLYFLLGLLFSDGDLEKGQTKLKTYEKIRQMHDGFKNALGATHCCILLGGTEPSFKKCRDKYETACLIFEKILAENNIILPEKPEFITERDSL